MIGHKHDLHILAMGITIDDPRDPPSSCQRGTRIKLAVLYRMSFRNQIDVTYKRDLNGRRRHCSANLLNQRTGLTLPASRSHIQTHTSPLTPHLPYCHKAINNLKSITSVVILPL